MEGADDTHMNVEESLREAAAAGDAVQLQLLLELGADPNAADAEGWTALHWSCAHEQTARLLLDNGAVVDAADRQGKTTLHWAATDGHADVAELLLLYGAHVNKVDHDLWTPLQWAHGKPHVLQLLLTHGADVHARDKFGKTVLHWSSQDGYLEAVQLLVAHGALVNIADADGMTPLHWAAHGGHVATVQLLLQSGADASIGAADSQGTSPLAWAAYAGHDQVIQLLVNQPNTSASITADNLLSAARAAAIQGHMEIFAVLAVEVGSRHPELLPSLLDGPLAPDPAIAFAAMTGLCVGERCRKQQHEQQFKEQHAMLCREREELSAVRIGTQHLILQVAGLMKRALQQTAAVEQSAANTCTPPLCEQDHCS